MMGGSAYAPQASAGASPQAAPPSEDRKVVLQAARVGDGGGAGFIVSVSPPFPGGDDRRVYAADFPSAQQAARQLSAELGLQVYDAVAAGALASALVSRSKRGA